MDLRERAAQYYDLSLEFPADVPFYLDRIPSGAPRVLELGCGTGRVSLPLARRSGFLHGVDHSAGMADICRAKLLANGLGPDRVLVSVADIADLHLDARFDFIVAPFRVLQNLATDAQVAGLFAGIREHLDARGRCILNVFRPYRDPEALRAEWRSTEEAIEWEVPVEGGRVVRSVRRTRSEAEPLVLYPDLIYRRYAGDRLVDETVLSIPMRCWYPVELLSRIQAEGFAVTGTWGGYAGEVYGEGPELVVEFTQPRTL
jgi:SAM-dependent methyltransferase